jgi:hypothetical protein
LLDKDAVRIDQALQAMAKAGMVFSVIQTDALPFGRDKIFLHRIALKNSKQDNFNKINITALKCFPEASIARNERSCFLTTSDQRKPERNFDFWCNLSNLEPSVNEVSVTAKVIKGRVDVFLISDNGQVVSSAELWPTDIPISRTLYAGKDGKANTLMIRNKMPDTCKSRLEVCDVNVGYLDAGSKSSKQVE